MASPFPGMDPFLESPTVFPSFHKVFLIYLETALQGLLPPAYFADTGERVWIEFSHRYIEPDTGVYRMKQAGPPPTGNGGIALAARPVVLQVQNDPRKEIFLEVYRRDKGGNILVCSIEMLSPANKARGEKGQGLYLKKQQELLESRVHLIEMDFLRAGQHTTAVPEDLIRTEVGPFDYHICCHRFDRPDEFFAYPLSLADRLPVLEIPLLPDDGTVALDLQAVMDQAYEAGPFRRKIDYTTDPVDPPLGAGREVWLKKTLADKGILR